MGDVTASEKRTSEGARLEDECICPPNPVAEFAANIVVERPSERFEKVGGRRALLAQLRPVAGLIEAYRKGESRLPLPRGLLFLGEYGEGKTYLARAFSGEAGCPFIYQESREILWSTSGASSADKVHALFDKARRARGALVGEAGSEKAEEVLVLFLDNFASVGLMLDMPEGRERERSEQALYALREEMQDPINEGILVIGGAEDPDIIEPLLISPRLFSHSYTLMPEQSWEDRLDILEKLTSDICGRLQIGSDSGTTVEEIARIAVSDTRLLRSIPSYAAELAVLAGRSSISAEDFYEAFQTKSYGPAQDDLLAPHRRESVAHHEHGHGWVSIACGLSPYIISMIPRGDSLGRVVYDVEALLDPPATRDDLLRVILSLAGGRAGELAAGGLRDSTDGVGQDFASMTKYAQTIVEAGMLAEGFYSTESEEAVKRICGNAVCVAKEILLMVGGEARNEVVAESLEMGREIIGPSARNFYEDHLTEETKKKMIQCVEAFLENPLGNEQAQK